MSVTGNFRDNNEDNLRVDPDARFFLVADGMGGQSAGEKASELAVELVSERLLQKCKFDSAQPQEVCKAIDDAVAYANAEIMALGELDSKFKNMGTTISFAVSAGGGVYVGGVGDSRVYLLRGDDLQQLTKDHSLTQALLDAGTITAKDAETHRYKNVLYRYLGTKEGSAGTDARRIDPQIGDRIVLCSDGVTDGIKAEQITELLGKVDAPQDAAEAIVEAALAGGSRDNVTCVVINVEAAA
ncbi:MAG: protein phosphatase 2C domain-containing protein [Planctomycetaceae bacterium]